MAPTLNDKSQSDKRPDASSTRNSLAKAEPQSLPTGLQKKEDVTAYDDTLRLIIDPSARTLTINKPIFGTNNKSSNQALVEQVCSIAPIAPGNDNLLNLKFALATINGIGAKDELEG
jgi:hypothetical protein